VEHPPKWRGEDNQQDWSEELRAEYERVNQLAEEMSAQARLAFDEESNTWNTGRMRVTDYKANSRVIFPRALPLAEERKLEVLRIELLHQYQLWVSANCSCDGDQKSNLSSEETRGLNSLRKRVREGDSVVLPTDKLGRFAIMSFQTYLEAGAVHTDGDREVGEEELKQNQSHKGLSSSKGGAPPTRPVIGGNQGMNSLLSELLSWLLEPWQLR
jgi:hypothetical protein